LSLAFAGALVASELAEGVRGRSERLVSRGLVLFGRFGCSLGEHLLVRCV
jgi:hypothetical protein